MRRLKWKIEKVSLRVANGYERRRSSLPISFSRPFILIGRRSRRRLSKTWTVSQLFSSPSRLLFYLGHLTWHTFHRQPER